ncbi:ferredoxin--NADP reductase [Rheinheimera sp. D18]|uniref:ferredoxin--NADP reductase n=1 Tax=Rheinheimera sp. D18 TaxID=2545632 RepID=UPI00104F0B5F|nr:ferredoxin--NADP reductase [Rheinheimera sp. D18]QBL10337.1 ferredoxin--NADP reductase [Rheinheimera sp. D18]
MAQWLSCTVTDNHHWHANLFSLKVKAPHFDFIAGQFVRLALDTPSGRVQRAYSLVNSPGQNELEFLVSTVADGNLSPLLQQLKMGDNIEVSQPASGFFILDEVPDGNNLWLISSGTGIGPYLSMLGTHGIWQRFKHIVLVHTVRTVADLAYREYIHNCQRQYPGQLYYQPIVTREAHSGALDKRIPELIQTNELQHACAQTLDEQSQIMLCGNPQMITETRTLLETMGLKKNLRRAPGNITVEQYWK